MTTTSLRPLMDAAENLFRLDAFRRRGGYESARKALDMAPSDVLAEVRKADLRGRGGAGFPGRGQVGIHPARRRQARLPVRQRR